MSGGGSGGGSDSVGAFREALHRVVGGARLSEDEAHAAVSAIMRGEDVRLVPQVEGGGQERGLRAGTLNVPGIVGFGEAARIGRSELVSESARLTTLRARL